jgi:hypothetical protein
VPSKATEKYNEFMTYWLGTDAVQASLNLTKIHTDEWLGGGIVLSGCGGGRDKVVGVVLRGQKREGFSRSQSPNGVKSRLALEVLSLQKTMMLTLE